MMLPPNAFKRGLAEGRSLIGYWCSLPGGIGAELLAGCGYDWLLFDTEHALTDVPDILPMLQAVAPYPVSPVVRPASNDPVLIKRLLDLGAQTLMIPYVQTAEEARAAVAAMRYAPRGIRGMAGMVRASRFGSVPDYARRAEEELCLIVQVETAEALARIDEIAAVDGVDALFIGPADLAASMGHSGDASHPEVRAAIEAAIKRIVAAGKPAGILTLSPEFAEACLGWGTTFTAVGMDLATLSTGARALARRFKG
ncbi:4-hydroxy-2-oxoheptanedioate aldolase [Gemmobacter aquatilis]|uniref:Hydroxypyruvate/pyruvate aldolase n=1 Tax=Gemmobacter aquatilis TaxID=933059 RepID=A0A1H8EZ05_9RHOB|nr:aldolase/citrate lyase family protein [Gemmobacter aquatilis]SEN24620.1 4-hydroxy-2-oxoheptanedioate aldolase [Gemmobacter aquatilis]